MAQEPKDGVMVFPEAMCRVSRYPTSFLYSSYGYPISCPPVLHFHALETQKPSCRLATR